MAGAYAEVQAAADPAELADRQGRAARLALEPPRLRLLTQFTSIPDGELPGRPVGFLLKVRDDELLAALDADLRGLLAAWFDIGFLELHRIDWNSPAVLLEKLVGYEAVRDPFLADQPAGLRPPLLRVLSSAYAGRPLIVEVALVKGWPAIAKKLDEKAPLLDPREADAAISYSIGDPQGLAGVASAISSIKRIMELRAKCAVKTSPRCRHPGFVPGWTRSLPRTSQTVGRMNPPLFASAMPAHGRAGAGGDLAKRGWWREAGLRKTAEQVLLAVRALSGGGERRQAGARSGCALPSVEQHEVGACSGRHLGEGRRGERGADGQLPDPGKSRTMSRRLRRRGRT